MQRKKFQLLNYQLLNYYFPRSGSRGANVVRFY
jgi:hypothetical protein